MAEVLYTLTKKNDTYSVTNNGGQILDYVLTDIDPCTEDTVVETGQIAVDATLEIKFPKDGLYELKLTDSTNGSNESTIIFKYYLTLQLSLIEDIFSSLCSCDCGCADCVDLGTRGYELLLTTRSKIDVFKYLSAPRYDAFLQVAHDTSNCTIHPEVYCDVTMEGITGRIEYNERLAKQLIALDYLAFYYGELKDLTAEDEITYIKEKFQSESILCCVNKLGIDIKEIENAINDMATITMNSGAYQNQPPSNVGDNTLNTTNRATYTFAMADFLVDYADPEGDAADAVRIDTLPPDGEIQLNGVAVSPGDIITKIDIDNNLLTFVPPDQDPADVDTFTFSVRDEGSGQFSS